MSDETTPVALRQEGPQQELQALVERWRYIAESCRASAVDEPFAEQRDALRVAAVNRDECAKEIATVLAALSASRTAQAPQDEGESLHTGDDERLDAVTSIVAGLEAMRDDPEANADITFDSLIEDCTALDALLLATIKRERAASRTVPAPVASHTSVVQVTCPCCTAMFDTEIPDLSASRTAQANKEPKLWQHETRFG